VREIAWCESRMQLHAKNHNANGTVDRGLLQVNSIHKEAAEDMGLNLAWGPDRLEYGVALLANQGTAPWYASEDCWNK